MTSRVLMRILLVAALLASQWAGFTHAATHSVGDAPHVCKLCHQPGLDHAVSGTGIALPSVARADEDPMATSAVIPRVAVDSSHPIRGPPVLL